MDESFGTAYKFVRQRDENKHFVVIQSSFAIKPALYYEITGSAVYVPDFPPVFSTSLISEITMDLSTAFSMS